MMLRELMVVYGLGVVILLCMHTRCGEGSLFNKCKHDGDCSSNYFKCHRHFKLCIKYNKSQSSLRTARKPFCNCRANEYCHPMFNQCFPNLTSTATKDNQTSVLPDCRNKSDCITGKYCHSLFKKCLDIPIIPTVATTRSSSVSCRNSTQCTSLQYCHDFFKICLVKPTTRAANATTTGPTVTSSVTSYSSCKRNSDCKPTEFCTRIFQGGTAQLVRLHRKSLDPSGTCLPRSITLKPPYLSCIRDKDCGKGKCCLKKIGICGKVKKQGSNSCGLDQ